jgi:hypothetical protein
MVEKDHYQTSTNKKKKGNHGSKKEEISESSGVIWTQ